MPTIIPSSVTAEDPGRPVLTATADDYVSTADFGKLGLTGIYAAAFLLNDIGIQVVIDEHLDAATRDDMVNVVLERLVEQTGAERFAYIDDQHDLPGDTA